MRSDPEIPTRWSTRACIYFSTQCATGGGVLFTLLQAVLLQGSLSSVVNYHTFASEYVDLHCIAVIDSRNSYARHHRVSARGLVVRALVISKYVIKDGVAQVVDLTY